MDISTSTGVLPNANNSEYHRLSRGIGRQAAAAQRARDAREQTETTADLKSLIAAEQALRKELIATEKKLQAELKGTKGAKKRSKCAVASSSTSGRVKFAGLRAGLNDSAGAHTCSFILFHLIVCLVSPNAEDNITPGALPGTSISGSVPRSGSSTGEHFGIIITVSIQVLDVALPRRSSTSQLQAAILSQLRLPTGAFMRLLNRCPLQDLLTHS